MSKTPVTVRIAPDLLEQVRRGAARDNRSLTNFIETALRHKLAVETQEYPARVSTSVKPRKKKR